MKKSIALLIAAVLFISGVVINATAQKTITVNPKPITYEIITPDTVGGVSIYLETAFKDHPEFSAEWFVNELLKREDGNLLIQKFLDDVADIVLNNAKAMAQADGITSLSQKQQGYYSNVVWRTDSYWPDILDATKEAEIFYGGID